MKNKCEKEMLLDLERSLFRYEIISDRMKLEELLHERFHEMGSSGMLYDRAQVIEALLTLNTDRNIVMVDFTCESVGRDCFLVHYRTRNENGAYYYRTSLWVQEERMKLIFHQSTRLAMDPKVKREDG